MRNPAIASGTDYCDDLVRSIIDAREFLDSFGTDSIFGYLV